MIQINKTSKLVLLLILLVNSLLAQNKTGYINASSELFYQLMNENNNAIIIDARTADNFEKDKIIGAINIISSDDLRAFVDTLDKETPLMVYCEVGKRSIQACNVLVTLQFTTVVNLKFGFEDWCKQKLPVIK